ncbi:hypothetical protein ACFLQI_03120 [Candidatus Undinarchaeota archaeon]
MRNAQITVFLLLFSAVALAAVAYDSSEFIVEHDIGTFKYIKSTKGMGITGDSYFATYEHQIKFREIVQEQSTYKVEVEIPKYRSPESIFNSTDGILRSTGAINYKIVLGISDTIVWPSGNYIVRLSYKHGSYFPSRLVTSYNARFPSEAPRPEYIQKFEVSEYADIGDPIYSESCGEVGKRVRGAFCSLQGGFERQRDTGDFCIEGYECRSNKCEDQLCTSPYSIIDKILSWLLF